MRKMFIMASSALVLSNPAIAQKTPTDWPVGGGTIQSGGSSTPMALSYGDLAPAAGTPSTSQPVLATGVIRARDGEIIESVGGDAIPALPLTVMSNGTMKYVTGGVGEEELAQLKSIENDFNIQMLIATTNGVFLSDATVRVVDTKDTVLFTVENAGPYFYLYLPAGDYMVEVTNPGGNMKSVKVHAPATGATKPVVRF